MIWLIGIACGALAFGAAVTLDMARGQRWRWGRTLEPGPAVGDGAYRSAPVAIEKPRRLPAVCGLASVTAVAWGTLTACVFAPMGALGCLCSIPRFDEQGWTFALGTAVLFALSVRGFAIGARLMGMASVLAVRRVDSAARAGQVARESLVHHALVGAGLALWLGKVGLVGLLFITIPSAIGAGQAALLLVARRVLHRLDSEDAAPATAP
jgi:hypothetical protein